MCNYGTSRYQVVWVGVGEWEVTEETSGGGSTTQPWRWPLTGRARPPSSIAKARQRAETRIPYFGPSLLLEEPAVISYNETFGWIIREFYVFFFPSQHEQLNLLFIFSADLPSSLCVPCSLCHVLLSKSLVMLQSSHFSTLHIVQDSTQVSLPQGSLPCPLLSKGPFTITRSCRLHSTHPYLEFPYCSEFIVFFALLECKDSASMWPSSVMFTSVLSTWKCLTHRLYFQTELHDWMPTLWCPAFSECVQQVPGPLWIVIPVRPRDRSQFAALSGSLKDRHTEWTEMLLLCAPICPPSPHTWAEWEGSLARETGWVNQALDILPTGILEGNF